MTNKRLKGYLTNPLDVPGEAIPLTLDCGTKVEIEPENRPNVVRRIHFTVGNQVGSLDLAPDVFRQYVAMEGEVDYHFAPEGKVREDGTFEVTGVSVCSGPGPHGRAVQIGVPEKPKTGDVTDMNGVEIEAGDRVRVHQDEGVREATVLRVFPDRPTENQRGHWVDIDGGDGAEGMMSYVLEVIR